MAQKKRSLQLLIALVIVGIFAVNSAAFAEENLKININTATAKQLMQLSGVGEKVAAKIIAYRDQHGPFKTPEELMKVKGFGPKTLEKNKDRIIAKLPKISMKKK